LIILLILIIFITKLLLIMENYINQQISPYSRHTSLVDFYNNINNEISNYGTDNESLESLEYNNINNEISNYDSDNESLETLDSHNDDGNIRIIRNSNDLVDHVINQVNLEHIRRPIVLDSIINYTRGINSIRQNNVETVLNQIEQLNNTITTNSINRNNVSIYNNLSYQNAIDESFEMSNNIDNKISKIKHNKKIDKLDQQKLNEDTDCAICMQTIKKNKSVYQIECNHKFHKQCLSEWLKEKFECPVCRHKI